MGYNRIVILAIFLGLGSQTAFAEGVTQLTTDKLTLVQDAVAVDANIVRLTTSAQSKTGFAITPTICAREYKLTFDLNAGYGTGAGFVIRKVREGRVGSNYGPYRERDIEHFLPNGEVNHLFSLHPDTWRDPGQRDDNSLYASKNDTILINETMPFRMKGTGWFTIRLHTIGDTIKVAVIKNGV